MSQDGRPPDPATRTEGEGETLDMPEAYQPFTPGQVLGGRYQILEMLGRGGMGEVWQAFDLKLRVEVALKALRSDLFKSERRLELLRQEVRAAREVMSPNVCRIFDLIEIEDRELVSMEYVDGATLLGVLQERGPLGLKEAQDIASQFLAGLEAIHKVGLVHRDIKPENIMLTRAGRVVVMDFGLARQETEGGGTVSGTPAYMAPEQAAGQTLDARADVYSAGVVLAEMVSPEGIKSFESRQSVWEGVRSEPAKLPDSPWAPVLKKAVAKDREGRYNTAHTLTRALEDVTLRVEGADNLHPYPGLASFTEENTEYFFGREAEVERMWRKLEGPARMLSLVGPSGAGKSSFVRAGLLPARHEGWTFLVVTPGEQPFTNLGGAITRAVAGDLEALEMMVRFAEPDVAIEVLQRWRRQHEHAILVVDQFEELFTLNPDTTQASFAMLLGRLPLEADVHVLVSMRDDFLGHCHEQPPLTPMFSDLTFLGTPAGGALRRAVVRPATKCGYRFEDDDLVEEMLAEVEGERGALPLLAFALAQLWEMRDRDSGILTRDAYHDIGGVGGALARHAEATIDRVGADRIGIVRELFRNLVTAERTRAVREWDELLSVFDGESNSLRASGDPSTRSSDSLAQDDRNSEATEDVLRELIDARLLTSYEVREDEHEPTRRVEIIHESLLANWPRLVRWQTQDADAVQLRDQLRQAARTWDEHDRTDDTLWTGSAYREFALWRERYPGGLTEIEEAFAAAMTSLATRRRRRRRVAGAIVVIFLSVVATVLGTLWRRSVRETRRAEASKLLSVAQLELESYPSAALAYATASLELADSEQARRMVLEALAAGPPATLLVVAPPDPSDEGDVAHDVVFSPNGAWAAIRGYDGFRIVSRDGSVNRSLEPLPKNEETGRIAAVFDPERNRLVECIQNGEFRIWSLPDFQLLESGPLPEGEHCPWVTRRGLYLVSWSDDSDETVVRVHNVNGETRVVGRMNGRSPYSIDMEGRWLAFVDGNKVMVRSLESWDLAARMIGSHETRVRGVNFVGEKVAADLEPGEEVWVWPVEAENEALGPFPIRERGSYFLDGNGNRLGVYRSQTDFAVEVWDLRTRRRSPSPLYRFPASVSAGRASAFFNGAAFVPGGWWIATAHVDSVAFWPLRPDEPKILAEDVTTGTLLGFRDLEFTPGGRHLLALVMVPGNRDEIWVWDLDEGGPSQSLASVSKVAFPQLAVDPKGRFAAVTTWDAIELVPLAGGPVQRLKGFSPGTWILDLDFDADGRQVAACGFRGSAENKVIRIWDLETGEVTVLGPIEGAGEGFDGGTRGVRFLADGSLVSSGWGGLRVWNVGENTCQLVIPGEGGRLEAFGRQVIHVRYTDDFATSILQVTDLETRATEVLPSRIAYLQKIAADPEGAVVVSSAFDGDGAVQVGRISGAEPHLLLGHERGVRDVAVSPDGRWIASAGHEGSVRLWPMPDLDKPPLHALPHDELIAKLKTFTNIRVVRDEESSTGWKVEVGPFPGWAEVPEW